MTTTNARPLHSLSRPGQALALGRALAGVSAGAAALAGLGLVALRHEKDQPQ